jgi:hypothetical protein
MTGQSDGYQVGYGHPPRETQWKKGQSGNPRKSKPKPREGALATMERLLLAPVRLTIDGEPKQVPALEAIVLQLLQKTMAENVRAARVLKKYKEFAHQNMKRKLDLTFVESAYTRAVAVLAKDGAE